MTREQSHTCARYGAEPVPSLAHSIHGIADNTRGESWPLNGLRHPPEGHSSGWYIWADEVLSDEPSFFRPVHDAHMALRLPLIAPYLALPPGWRFLIAPGLEDVWYDKTLLEL
ncbi:hypothetical protein D1871_02145 [Nakamurella silvestris]|nr:hypothetical protein D1871_02145 [Nakamurella silvestris]